MVPVPRPFYKSPKTHNGIAVNHAFGVGARVGTALRSASAPERVTRIVATCFYAAGQGKWEGGLAYAAYTCNAYGSYAGLQGRSAHRRLFEQAPEQLTADTPGRSTREALADGTALDGVEIAKAGARASRGRISLRWIRNQLPRKERSRFFSPSGLSLWCRPLISARSEAIADCSPRRSRRTRAGSRDRSPSLDTSRDARR